MAMKIDPNWHRDQVRMYRDEYPHYQIWARVMTEILTRACQLYAPLSIVQTRPKSVSSFAEKAVRKAHKYACPVLQITDLCGGRVITETEEEADEICEFVRANFVIDEANSLDVRTRLKESEFGYLSVHYVVQLLKDSDFLRAVVTENDIKQVGNRKAEIQVRTLLQHAWATNTHDRLYKSEFKVPQDLYRETAMLAAGLEQAEGGFTRFIKSFDAYAGNYAAYMTKEKMQQEIAMLELILQNEPDPKNRPSTALRIARVAGAAGDYETIIRVLTEFENSDSELKNVIPTELGHALCQSNREAPEGEGHKKGQALLERVVERLAIDSKGTGPGKRQARSTRARALSLLAWAYANTPDGEFRARDLYQEALTLDSQNPYILSSLLELEICCYHNHDFLGTMRPALLEALKTCRAHADLGIELPRAFFTMGRIRLLMDEPYESLETYAKGVQLCLSNEACVTNDVFNSELKFLSRINSSKHQLPTEHEWVRRLLLLGRSLKTKKDNVSEDIRQLALRKDPFAPPVVIVAGGTDPSIEEEMAMYRDYLSVALKDFDGTVISGGTRAGIPGLVGEITHYLKEKKCKKYLAIGYLSKHLPADAPKDDRYDEHIPTSGQTLSPLEPLQNWIDLLAAGVRPGDVRLLGINGGSIAGFEYRLALALGATVGVVDFSGRAVSGLLSESDWLGGRHLLQLPRDPMTVKAFVSAPRTQLDQDWLDRLARTAHEEFLKENRHKLIDPSGLPWKELREDLKESNRQQVAYAEQVLNSAGYAIRKATGSITICEFTQEDVEKMAEMEHGRWNVERLQSGWKYGPERDVNRRISPYLKPWKDLSEEVKGFDRKAVRDLPAVLSTGGLEVYRLDGSG